MKALLLLTALAGCAGIDPLTRPGVWHPVGANDANLLAMIVNPLDLVNGAASPIADGAIAAGAVARYHADKVKTLPDSGVAQVSAVGFGASGQPAAGAN